MKTLMRLCASTACALIISATGFAQHYTQTNLVSNTSGAAPVTDPQLINPWGLSRASGSPWWISDQATGFSTLYNGPGVKQSLIVTIPPSDPTNKNTPIGSPTGTIANGSQTDFLLAPGKPAVFLFSTIDGTIAGWNPAVALAQGSAPPSTNAVTVQAVRFSNEQSSGNSNNNNKGPFSENSFVDEHLPDHYVPFNVQAIGDDIVVTYALHEGSSPFETDGPGLGFVDIYSSTGQLLRRLQHGDWLNAPWGVALAPLDFGRFSHDLLIGQFAGGGDTQSSGFIAAYDLATGKFDGLLEDASGKPLAINGIWSLSPGNVSPSNNDPAAAPAAEVYFTAGPNHGSGGLFGYLTAVSAELTEGNAQ
jgi:uncharacterized protein (TIGR03118 family)